MVRCEIRIVELDGWDRREETGMPRHYDGSIFGREAGYDHECLCGGDIRNPAGRGAIRPLVRSACVERVDREWGCSR